MERVIGCIINTMLSKGVIDERQKSIMGYGLDLLLSTVISMSILIAIGIALNQGLHAVCFLLPFVLYQGFGGGYHCQTHFGCWTLMACNLLIALFVLQKLPTGLLFLGAAISAYPILVIAPVQNPKAPFSENFGKRMHQILIGIYVGCLGLAGAFQLLAGDGEPILWAIILSGLSIASAYWHNKKLP